MTVPYAACVQLYPPEDEHLLTYLLTYLLTPWSRFLLEKLTGSAASQEIPVPATCPYPEPTPSSPHNPLPLPEDPS